MENLIQAKDYLLFVDKDDKIKKGGYAYQINFEGTNAQAIKIESNFQEKIANTKNGSYTKYKIIAYYPLTKEAKELNLPLLPPFEERVDVEKLACAKYNVKDGIRDYDERYYNTINVAKAEAFIEGYKEAQSNKRFSLEDIEQVIKLTLEDAKKSVIWSEEYYKHLSNRVIQSLSTQQLPKEFIPETIGGRYSYDMGGNIWIPKELKTITNSEGKQELVGTYKYK